MLCLHQTCTPKPALNLLFAFGVCSSFEARGLPSAFKIVVFVVDACQFSLFSVARLSHYCVVVVIVLFCVQRTAPWPLVALLFIFTFMLLCTRGLFDVVFGLVCFMTYFQNVELLDTLGESHWRFS